MKDIIEIDGVTYKRVEEDKGEWPQKGDFFNYIKDGRIYTGLYYDINEEGCDWKKIMDIGNMFPTKQDALNHLRFLLIQERIRQLAGDQSWIDWEDDIEKYYIFYWRTGNMQHSYTRHCPMAGAIAYFQEDPTNFLFKEIGGADLKFYCEYTR